MGKRSRNDARLRRPLWRRGFRSFRPFKFRLDPCVVPGMLVHGDRVVAVLSLGEHDVGAILDFTAVGDLLIESAAMYNSVLGPHH